MLTSAWRNVQHGRRSAVGESVLPTPTSVPSHMGYCVRRVGGSSSMQRAGDLHVVCSGSSSVL